MLVTALLGWLVAGLVVGPLFGGATVIMHYTLRIFLWRCQVLPLQLVPIFDFCVDRILLRRVGGGYIFIHRMLMEYLASLEPMQTSVQVRISCENVR
jgi:hypothetical protein